MTSYPDVTEHADTFIPHAFDEHTVDLGEIQMNNVIVATHKPGATAAPGPDRI